MIHPVPEFLCYGQASIFFGDLDHNRAVFYGDYGEFPPLRKYQRTYNPMLKVYVVTEKEAILLERLGIKWKT